MKRKILGITLGPKGHELTKMQLLRMIAAAIKEVKNGGGRNIDLSY